MRSGDTQKKKNKRKENSCPQHQQPKKKSIKTSASKTDCRFSHRATKKKQKVKHNKWILGTFSITSKRRRRRQQQQTEIDSLEQPSVNQDEVKESQKSRGSSSENNHNHYRNNSYYNSTTTTRALSLCLSHSHPDEWNHPWTLLASAALIGVPLISTVEY